MQARDKKVRNFIYSHFIDLQRPPATSEIAAHLGLSRDRVIESLHRLHAAHVIVLESGRSDIRMAMPFSAVDTRIRVTAGGKSWWANCAWDALGIPAMLKTDAVIETSCADCREPISIRVSADVPTGNAEIIRFEIAPPHFWDNIVHT